MATPLTKTAKAELDAAEFNQLREMLLVELRLIKTRLAGIERALQKPAAANQDKRKTDNVTLGSSVPRRTPLDQLDGVMAATADLRVASGKLAADRMANLFGVSLSQLAQWLGRTKQAVSKTPDADSLQDALGFFERVARLRLVTEDDEEFRKWLRMPNDLVHNRPPLEWLAQGKWQALADKVEDLLTGMPA